VLAAFFGTDAIPFSLSFDGLPGVTRSFDSFSAAANEAGQARIWAGIHWSFDVTAGNAQGAAVATYIVQNCLLPRTSPRPPTRAGLTHLGMNGLTPAEEVNPIAVIRPGQHITSGRILETVLTPGGSGSATDETPADRSLLQPDVYQITATSVVSDTHALEMSGPGFERVPPPNHGGNVEAVFGSADWWDGMDGMR
jgi:hypothetical protein